MACNGVVVRLHRLWYFTSALVFLTSALVFLTSALKNWRCLAVSSFEICRELRLSCRGFALSCCKFCFCRDTLHGPP